MRERHGWASLRIGVHMYDTQLTSAKTKSSNVKMETIEIKMSSNPTPEELVKKSLINIPNDIKGRG